VTRVLLPNMSNPWAVEEPGSVPPQIKSAENGRLYGKPSRRAVIHDWHLARSGKPLSSKKTASSNRSSSEAQRRAELAGYWKRKGLTNSLENMNETNVRKDRWDKCIERTDRYGDQETDAFLWTCRVHLGHANTCVDPRGCTRDENHIDDFRVRPNEKAVPTERCAATMWPSITVRHKFDNDTIGGSYEIERAARYVDKLGPVVRKLPHYSHHNPNDDSSRKPSWKFV
jgi:hypothetical protein